MHTDWVTSQPWQDDSQPIRKRWLRLMRTRLQQQCRESW
jgi:hypothetical protein